MNKSFCFVIVAAFLAACSFDSSGLPSNTNNNNNTNTNNTDPCKEVDCGHGDCLVQDATSFTCDCEENWTGDVCDECIVGYTGEFCDECANGALQLEDGSCIEDPCAGITACSNHGECSVDLSTGDYACDCAGGYEGDDCETCSEFHVEFPADSGNCLIDACNGVDCGSQGACVMTGEAAFVCDCALGYAGAYCTVCDEANGYIEHNGACVVSPCQGFDCGIGECTVDATEFTPSCDCPPERGGEHCEIDLTVVLVYKNFWGQLFVQVHNASWGNFTGDVRTVYQGESTGAAIVYHTQSAVDENGWLELEPCSGVSENVKIVVAEPPYDAASTLLVVNAASPDPKDPDGFIYTDGNGTTIRAQCICVMGICGISAAGNDP